MHPGIKPTFSHITADSLLLSHLASSPKCTGSFTGIKIFKLFLLRAYSKLSPYHRKRTLAIYIDTYFFKV